MWCELAGYSSKVGQAEVTADVMPYRPRDDVMTMKADDEFQALAPGDVNDALGMWVFADNSFSSTLTNVNLFLLTSLLTVLWFIAFMFYCSYCDSWV